MNILPVSNKFPVLGGLGEGKPSWAHGPVHGQQAQDQRDHPRQNAHYLLLLNR
jgi:hypothetical protein